MKGKFQILTLITNWGKDQFLTVNNKQSGRGQSGIFYDFYLLKPSAPPQVQST
jgi:hypothetical protein